MLYLCSSHLKRSHPISLIVSPAVSCCLSEQIRHNWGNVRPLSLPFSHFSWILCLHFLVRLVHREQHSADHPASSSATSSGALFLSVVRVELIKHRVCDDNCSLHFTYGSICRRLFSNLLHTGRSVVRKCASQAAN